MQLVELTGKRPLKLPYPEALTTIGHHIRKVRYERGLNLPQASKIMQISKATILNWEMGHSEPCVKSIPKIIEFLGYLPFDDESDQSIGKRLWRYRMREGISIKQLGKLIRSDGVTIARIERNEGKSFDKTIRKIEGYLNRNMIRKLYK